MPWPMAIALCWDSCGRARIKGANGGIVPHSGQRGHPQVRRTRSLPARLHDVAFGAARPAIAIDATGRFDGQDAEYLTSLPGSLNGRCRR